MLIVKSKATIESHPETAPPTSVNVAELLLAVYVLPSIQVKDSHAVWVSVPYTILLMVKSSVTMESQPFILPFGIVNVAVLLLAV